MKYRHLGRSCMISTSLDDKIRLLTTLVRGMARALVFSAMPRMVAGLPHTGDDIYVTFGNENTPIGSLIVASTSGIHDYAVGWLSKLDLEEYRRAGKFTVRELGSQRICHMCNEMFMVVNRISKIDFLEGKQQAFFVKAWQAVQAIDYRYVDVDFSDDGNAKLTIKKKHWNRNVEETNVEVHLRWNRRDSKKAIVSELETALQIGTEVVGETQ